MDIFKIVSFGIAAMVLSVIVKKDSPFFSLMIGIVASVFIFMMLIPKLSSVLELMEQISKSTGSGAKYVGTVMKVIGIAYAAEFGAQICIDAGENSIASKIELAGKVLIMAVSAPIVITLLEKVVALA